MGRLFRALELEKGRRAGGRAPGRPDGGREGKKMRTRTPAPDQGREVRGEKGLLRGGEPVHLKDKQKEGRKEKGGITGSPTLLSKERQRINKSSRKRTRVRLNRKRRPSSTAGLLQILGKKKKLASGIEGSQAHSLVKSPEGVIASRETHVLGGERTLRRGPQNRGVRNGLMKTRASGA